MNIIEKVMAGWQTFLEKVNPVLRKAGQILTRISDASLKAWGFISRMRKPIAAIPVAAAAVMLALYNLGHLPAVVGIGLMENGSFTLQIARVIAVFIPCIITGLCLLLMFCSRRILTPWLVSAVTLLIPVIILITNVFPA